MLNCAIKLIISTLQSKCRLKILITKLTLIMSGIYIHIPFCKQRCNYCNFYSTVNHKYQDKYVDTVITELEQRKDYLGTKEIDTIYFGGGTPSVLSEKSIQKITDKIYSTFKPRDDAEVTFEANPDDLTDEYIDFLAESKINRLSIGIQSFNDDVLKKMNRRHSSEQAKNVVKQAKKKGFTNISIDLIYGFSDNEYWQEQLEQAFNLNVQHLSAYHLTIEENTVFHL